MNKQYRLQEILNIIKDEESITSNELAERFNVSASTIRRDFQKLEDMKLIARFYGGIKEKNENRLEPPMEIKENLDTESKKLIARYAASQIKDNQMIYLDAGSTTYEMINYITAKNIIVVTVGTPHIERLLARGILTIVLGGTVRPSTHAITGKPVIEQLENYYFDQAFLGCNSIHPIKGISTTNEQEAAGKAKAIQRSVKTYILANANKFNVITPNTFAQFKDVTIITDTKGDFEAPELNCIETLRNKK